MQKLQIQYRAVKDLKPRPGNPRTHSKKQIDQIARSIQQFGFITALLIDETDQVIAGHGRLAAAKQLGLKEAPTIRIADMSEADIRAYVIADNRLAERAGWDHDLLRVELDYLSGLEIDFDVTLTGFEAPEIDLIISDPINEPEAKGDPADTCLPAFKEPAVTQAGDVWIIGRHHLICGDATRPETYDCLLQGKLAQMVFADPPYNVPVQGHISSKRSSRHREFAMASGEMTSAEFVAFLKTVFEQLARHSCDGAIHFQCMDWRHMSEMLAAGSATYSELKNLCVWSKSGAGMGSFYRSRHELVFVFKSGAAPHINNIDLGRYGRNRTNVWEFPGVNGPGSSRADLELHPTVKPVALVAEAIRDCSHRRGLVLDPFAGSGSTFIAAERAGRIAYGIEIDPLYCDVIIRRLRTVCNLSACLAETGETFEALRQRRDVGDAGKIAVGGKAV